MKLPGRSRSKAVRLLAANGFAIPGDRVYVFEGFG